MTSPLPSRVEAGRCLEPLPRRIQRLRLIPEGPQLFNRSDASTYSGIISGTGAVTKQGGGTLTFSGANSNSNLTTIAGGTLALSGLGSIGTGGLSLGTGGFFDIAALASGTYSLPSTGPSVPMIGETPAFPLLE